MATADYDVRIDWNNTGIFTGTGEDVSSRTLSRRSPITIRYGRDQARSLSPVRPGTANLLLNNESRDYSPDNAASPLAGNLRTGRSLRVQASLNAVTYGLYRGFLDDYELLPMMEDRSVRLTGTDALGRLNGVDVTTQLHEAVRTGEALNIVLDAIGWPSADRDIDLGATIIPWFWENKTDAFTALENIVNSEGPPAMATADIDGKFVFRDRHHRLTTDSSLTSQATFRGQGTEPLHSDPFVIDYGWKEIINILNVPVEERTPSEWYEEVWSSDEIYRIESGQTLDIKVETNDPLYAVLTPEEGTDYRVRSGTVSFTDLSGVTGSVVTISITASGGTAVIDQLQLRGRPLEVRRTVRIDLEDATSIGRYGRRTYPLNLPWANVHDALAIADIVIDHRAERLPIISMTVENANETRLEQQLSRDLSDRITIVEDEAVLNDDFYIESIQHTISEGQMYHATQFGCEKVLARETNLFTFGNPDGLLLSGDNDFASTPDDASLDITGDIDIRAWFTPDDSATGIFQYIVAKYDFTTNQRSYTFRLDPAGNLELAWSTDGTNVLIAESTIDIEDHVPAIVRVTMDVNDGAGGHVVRFYTASSFTGSWTLVDTIQDPGGAGTTSIFSSTSDLDVGGANSGTAGDLAGVTSRVQVRSGIGGTIVANPDFTAEDPGTTSFNDSTGKTWTLGGGAEIVDDPGAGKGFDDGFLAF